MNKKWTDEEDELLKKIYETESQEVIMDHLKKNWLSIRGRARKLGLKRSRDIRNKYRKTPKLRSDGWTEEEITLLKKIYPIQKKKFIIASFNRTWNSIWSYAYNMGLFRDKEVVKQEMIEAGKNAPRGENVWTKEEDELLKQLYSNNHREFILEKFKNRTWRAMRCRAAKLKIRRNEELVNKDRVEIVKQNTLKKYGVESHWQLDSVKEKSKATNMARRGVEYALKSPEVRAKINETVQNRYGVDNVFQLEKVKEKIVKTNIEKYGVPNALQNKEIHEKSKNTNIKRYGIENPFQMIDRVQAGMIKKYGKKSPLQVPEIMERVKETNIKKYGFPFRLQNPEQRKKLSIILQSDEVREKKYKTAQKKESFSSSIEEKVFFEFLKQIDPNIRTHRLHPVIKFVIDYYSPKYDLWIQFDGVYWHGKFFIDTGTEQAEAIKKIMANDKVQNENIQNLIRFWSDDAQNAIDSGTILDLILNKIKGKIDDLKNDPKYNICHQYRKKLETYEDDLQNIPFNPDNVKVSDFILIIEQMSSDIIKFIEKYEWLGTIGRPPKWCFTARYKGFLGGVILINEPNSYSNILGKDTITYEALIQRGATASWTPKNLGSCLIMFSCKWMVNNTLKRIFIGYADPQAGERGIIYQACGFDYLGNDFGTPFLYKHPDIDHDYSQQELRSTSSLKKWCLNNKIETNRLWFKDNGFKNLKNIPDEVKEGWYSWIKKILSESDKIKIERKMKYALVLGKNKREKKYLNSLKTYANFEYPKEVFQRDITYAPKPNFKPTSGKTRNRKNPSKLEFLIQNHGKMSRKEMANSINESVRWVKRQLLKLAVNNQITVKETNEHIEEWPHGSENRAIELRKEFRKTNKEISDMLLKEFDIKISPSVLQGRFNKIGCEVESKQEWLKRHLSVGTIWELLNKNYRMIDITMYLKDKYKVYISDDQVLTYLQSLNIPSLRQKKFKKNIPQKNINYNLF